MKRNKFSLSHYKLLTCDMGELIPCGLIEVLPGDTIQQATSALVRVSPLLTPVMHPVSVRIHHWFVPHRLVWDGWEDFITGGPDGMDATAFPTKVTSAGTHVQGGLLDYLGIMPGLSGPTISALPMRGYQLIRNEWYRDQDLQGEAAMSKGSGNDTTTSSSLHNVSWEKDYFTTARPWEQKGPAVSLPLGSTAPVQPAVPGVSQPTFTSTGFSGSRGLESLSGAKTVNIQGANATGSGGLIWDVPSLRADLSGATAATINDLREAMAIQRYEEARARYGSRYTEYLRCLGVKSSDARLQRPEYLGGGKQTIQFSEVLQTAPTTTPAGVVGEMRGHGIGAMRSNRYRRFFEEHGYIFSLLSVIPRTMYVQGMPRTFNRRIKEDFFQKELQHIGQQPVLNKEVAANHATPDGTFGYQDRYDEYRRLESSVHGEFRTTLDMWHYGRIFASDPALNSTFVTAVPTKRVNAVQTNDVLWVYINHSIQARRIVAAQGTSHVF